MYKLMFCMGLLQKWSFSLTVPIKWGDVHSVITEKDARVLTSRSPDKPYVVDWTQNSN